MKYKHVIGSINRYIKWHTIALKRWPATNHYIDVIMTTMASQITSLTVVYLTVYSDAYQRKYQSSASLDFVWGFHRDRWIPPKGSVTQKMLPLDSVIKNDVPFFICKMFVVTIVVLYMFYEYSGRYIYLAFWIEFVVSAGWRVTTMTLRQSLCTTRDAWY